MGLRKIEPIRRLSPSTLDQAETCMKRLEFKLQGWRGGGSENTVEGTGYHAGLARYYEERLHDQTLLVPSEALLDDCVAAAFDAMMSDISADLPRPPDYDPELDVEATDEEIAGWDGWDDDTWVTARTKVAGAIHRYFAQGWQWPAGYEVEAVEAEVGIDLGVDGWVASKGFIDLVLVELLSGDVVLVDHKTASRMWAKSKDHVLVAQQAGYYPIAWEQFSGVRPEWTYFDIHTWGGKFERRGISSEHAMRVINKMVELAAQVDALEAAGVPFPASPSSNLCSKKYCDYWTICPYGGLTEETE